MHQKVVSIMFLAIMLLSSLMGCVSIRFETNINHYNKVEIGFETKESATPSMPAPSATTTPPATATKQAQATVAKSVTPLPTSTQLALLDVSLLWQRGSGNPGVVGWSPDGTIYAVGTTNGVRVYDAISNSEIRRLNEGFSSTSISFNNDGTILAIGENRSNVIKLFNPQTGSLIRTLLGFSSDLYNHPGGIAFSPDGKYVAASMQSQPVIIWDINSGTIIKKFPGLSTWIINSAAPIRFSARGDQIAYVVGDGLKVVIRDVPTWAVDKYVEKDNDISIYDFVFSSDGKWIALGGLDGNLDIIDLKSGNKTRSLPASANIFTMTISKAGDRLAVGGWSGTIVTWDTSTWKPTTLAGINNPIAINSLSISADAKKLLASCGDGLVRIWDVESESELSMIPFENVGGLSIAFSKNENNNYVTAQSSGSTIRTWEAITGKEVNRFFDGVLRPVSRIDVTRNGDLLALGTWQWNSTVIWNTRTDSLVFDVPYQKNNMGTLSYNSVLRVKFSPDQKWLAIGGSKGKVILWDISKSKVAWQKQSGYSDINALAFDPDGGMLAVGGNSVYILDTKDGNQIQTFQFGSNARDLAFSPDGKRLAVAGYGVVNIVDVNSGKVMKLISVGMYPFTAVAVNGISFRSDGKYIATATQDGRVSVWDVASGRLAANIDQFTQPAYDVQFSFDGSLMAASSESGIFKIWQVVDK